MLTSSFAFYVGVMLQAATLGKHIFDITGRAIDIGWLGLAEFAPIALLVFVSGSVADRYNRKHVAAIALAGELMCALLLLAYSISIQGDENPAVWPFF
jgi:MFS family permease